MKTQALSLLCAVCSNQLAYLVCTVRPLGGWARVLFEIPKEFPAE